MEDTLTNQAVVSLLAHMRRKRSPFLPKDILRLALAIDKLPSTLVATSLAGVLLNVCGEETAWKHIRSLNTFFDTVVLREATKITKRKVAKR